MAKVKARQNESFEQLLRRFKRSCDNEKVVQEAKDRQYYEKPTQARRKAKVAAERRHLKKIAQEKALRERKY